jgi:hypothetical protein
MLSDEGRELSPKGPSIRQAVANSAPFACRATVLALKFVCSISGISVVSRPTVMRITDYISIIALYEIRNN